MPPEITFSDSLLAQQGYNKFLYKNGVLDYANQGQTSSSVVSNPITDSFQPGNIMSGSTNAVVTWDAGNISSGKTKYDNTETGYILGVDPSDKLVKFYIGNTTNYLNWTGTALNVAGVITASEIHIPDVDTTDDSFHVDTDANTWWGCTETNFSSSVDNATAYILKTGVAKFQSVTLTGSVIATDFQPGTDIAIQGWSSSVAFVASDYRTVTWSAGGTGQIKILDGTTYTIAAGTTGNISAKTYIYLDINVSTTVLQITTTAATAVGKGKILVCVAENNADTSSKASFQAFGGYGGNSLFVDSLAANSASTNEFVSNTAQIKDLIVTNAKINDLVVSKLTSGSITSKQIDLTFLDTVGDVYIGCGSYNSATWTATNGFIIGIDDSDSNKVKAYFGDATDYMSYVQGTGLTIAGTLTVGSFPVLPSDENLALHLSFDEGSGATVYDYSQNTNKGTITGATFVTGISGTALTFDGASGKCQVTDHASIQDIFSGGGTVSFWINPNSDGEGNFGRIWDKGGSNYCYVAGESGGNVYLTFGRSFSGTSYSINTGVNIPINTWTHIIIVYTSTAGEQATVYKNGVDQGLTGTTTIGTRTTDVGSDLYIGNRAADDRTFDGEIDEFRIYTGLTATSNQAKALYLYPSGLQQQGVASDRGLLAGWTISATTIANSTNIILDASNKKITINDATFGNAGIQLDYNAGTPRGYIGDGANQYLNFDGTNLSWKGNNAELATDGTLTVSKVVLTGIQAGSDIAGGYLTNDSVLNAARNINYANLNLCLNKFADFEQYANTDTVGTEDNITSTADTTNFIFGTKSLKLVSTNTNAACYFGPTTTTYNIPVEASTDYILSFWAKGNAGSETVRTTLRVNNGDAFRTGSDKTITTSWVRYENIISTLASDTAAEITFGTPNNAETFWIDGVQLEKADQSASTQEASAWKPGAMSEFYGQNIIANTITADEIAATTITGTQIATLAISGKSCTFDTGTVGGWTMAAGSLSNGSVTIDATNEIIRLGSASAVLTGNGIWMGKDGSDYELRVGDPTTDYMHFDGTVLNESNSAFVQRSLGGGIRQEHNVSILTDGYTSAGTGVTTISTWTTNVRTNTNDTEVLYSTQALIDASADFSFAIRAKFTQAAGDPRRGSAFIGISDGTNNYFLVSGVDTTDHAGIYLYSSASPNAWDAHLSTSDGTTQTVSSAITGVTLSNYNDYKVVKTSTSVKLYVGGVLKATNSTNLPDDTTSNFKFSVAQSNAGQVDEIDFYNNFRLANG